jgi:hypothetical protein
MLLLLLLALALALALTLLRCFCRRPRSPALFLARLMQYVI